jgi:hypothetical protein
VTAERAMCLEFSEPSSNKNLAFSIQASETRSGFLQTPRVRRPTGPTAAWARTR